MGILTNILFHKVNNVGLHEAQNELTKLISRRELFPGKSVVKKLSNLEKMTRSRDNGTNGRILQFI